MKKRNKPLLTICVPTYNRALEVERLFPGLLPQMDNQTELIVRDDSTNQQTKAVFDNSVVGGKLPYRYYHGPKVGLDAASMSLLEGQKSFTQRLAIGNETQPKVCGN